MSQIQVDWKIGQKINHKEFGEGIVTSPPNEEYVEVFFQSYGSKSVPIASITKLESNYQQAIDGVTSTTDRIKEFFLASELAELPLLDNAASLTSAKVDLLPHQIVLVHKVANASPRRFLVADDVGLGKTIETALLLRELASRGELNRALMIVPAGLVENWRRELNEVFNLNFEVFGSEGDVTDRKTNAFAKHNRLIASIDTLKRPKRVENILKSPKWDLIVFDEAHHLTAVERGANKVHKTDNYLLGESVREHTRDLLLLSATPHQGEHFRFLRLIHLLDPMLFSSVEDMMANKHRLNSVVIRRTKADACDPDGDTLFARRQVTTKAFHLSETEKIFYERLNNYLREGFALAQRSSGAARAIGFVMSIFQKIAASSFAAVKRTLQNRYIALAIYEAVLAEEDKNLKNYETALAAAKEMLRIRDSLPDNSFTNAIIDKYITDIRVKHHKKKAKAQSQEDEAYLDDEQAAGSLEGNISVLATVAMPDERRMINDLLSAFPVSMESKVKELNKLLSILWGENENEKVVIFATYLGTVEMLKKSIETVFAGKRVEIYKGGDHSAKIAAEKRFKAKDGPQVLICTAAGREGINLQYSRVLINFDLPWNPMDVEQRIGRIHRYGQKYTSQVYNFVSIDTIEGNIYLTLEQKIKEIAATLGKVDENGEVAEDLRSQILGQLGTHVSYDQIYRDALSDPKLERTKVELKVAIDNAKTARAVIFELFQDLDSFDLSEYKNISNASGDLPKRLFSAFQAGLSLFDGSYSNLDNKTFEVSYPKLGSNKTLVTFDRDLANGDSKLTLLGFDHPIVANMINTIESRKNLSRAVAVRAKDDAFLLVVWRISFFGEKGSLSKKIIKIAFSKSGHRLPEKEHLDMLVGLPPVSLANVNLLEWSTVLDEIPKSLERDLKYRGLLTEKTSYQPELIGILVGV
ncbi:MAG: DEAD/DEAH box helicase family protein [Bacteriovorax sp.]|nr:DEAD/DEAH box helicase family protein [Bacteriovorax sp.]